MKRLVRLAIILILVLGLFYMTRTLWHTYQAGKRVDVLASEVQGLREEKEQYGEELVYRQTDEFVEKEARDKLNMAMPGESVIIISDSEIGELDAQEHESRPRPEAIPEQWKDLLLGVR